MDIKEAMALAAQDYETDSKLIPGEYQAARIAAAFRTALETDTPDGMGEFLRTLCKQHGLTSASVSFTYAPPGPFFYAYVHWNDANGEQRCVAKHGPDAETAVLCAIEAMKDKRAAEEQAA